MESPTHRSSFLPRSRSRMTFLAYWACLAAYPNRKGYITDVCVPVSKLADCIVDAQDRAKYVTLFIGLSHSTAKCECREVGLPAPIVGHVGDGNFHSLILVRPDNHQEIEKAKEISNALVERALRCGGTCTGHLSPTPSPALRDLQESMVLGTES